MTEHSIVEMERHISRVSQLKRDIIECSHHYTKDCYVATVDIHSFFMSIPKKTC